MNCLHPIEPLRIRVTPAEKDNTFSDYYQCRYRFSNLTEVQSGDQICDGERDYTLAERIGRAIAGALIILLTLGLGFICSGIRSLFDAKHRIIVSYDNSKCRDVRMELTAEGKIVFISSQRDDRSEVSDVGSVRSSEQDDEDEDDQVSGLRTSGQGNSTTPPAGNHIPRGTDL